MRNIRQDSGDLSLPHFSVVMSVYSGNIASEVRESIESIFRQTILPSELIIVIDGEISADIQSVISYSRSLYPVIMVQLNKNLGPGAARHNGIKRCNESIIAVMDADDICVPDRFQKQLNALVNNSFDIVGGWIEEFEKTPGDLNKIRSLPENHLDILRFAKRRSPMNNATIMFRREVYDCAGGYAYIRSFEDYDLFIRMFLKGAIFYNIPQVLVHVRTARDFMNRRGGFYQVPLEIAMMYRMYKSGFIHFFQLVTNIIIRTSVRLVPIQLRRVIYQHLLR